MDSIKDDDMISSKSLIITGLNLASSGEILLSRSKTTFFLIFSCDIKEERKKKVCRQQGR